MHCSKETKLGSDVQQERNSQSCDTHHVCGEPVLRQKPQLCCYYRKSALALSISKIQKGKREGRKEGKRQKPGGRRNKVKTKENDRRKVRVALYIATIASGMLEGGNKKGMI